jgi:hypothetical protein
MALFFECTPPCAHKEIDTADIVRDGDVTTTIAKDAESPQGLAFVGHILGNAIGHEPSQRSGADSRLDGPLQRNDLGHDQTRETPYSQRMLVFFTFIICIGYFFIWFYWKSRNWARIAVLLVSFASIPSLQNWNRVSFISCASYHTSPHFACGEGCSRCGSLVLAEYTSGCRVSQAG